MIPPNEVARLQNALPFWLSLGLVPLLAVSVWLGGLWLLLVPVSLWAGYPALDKLLGLDTTNKSLETSEAQLSWYRLVTLVWPAVQFLMIFGAIAYVVSSDMAVWEQILLMYGLGLVTGAVGITYSHELMHQSNRLERWLGDILLAMVLYSHFRSEHLLVHHSYVGTPRDAVTARYNEGFWRFFARILPECFVSAWRAEKALLARAGKSAFGLSNPFWRYFVLEVLMVLIAAQIGGWHGVLLFAVQALVAILLLEVVNYVEHYGLTRKYLGDGKYEIVLPRHSWNAAHKATNWLLINLQRHSDHHYKPKRRFPLLQNYDASEAPQLPLGYPLMGAMALLPRLWKRRMNPRVRKWRELYYPEITDWQPYNKAALPAPKGSS